MILCARDLPDFRDLALFLDLGDAIFDSGLDTFGPCEIPAIALLLDLEHAMFYSRLDPFPISGICPIALFPDLGDAMFYSRLDTFPISGICPIALFPDLGDAMFDSRLDTFGINGIRATGSSRLFSLILPFIRLGHLCLRTVMGKSGFDIAAIILSFLCFMVLAQAGLLA